MRVPILDEIPVTRRYIDTFKGYNHNRVIGEDEFYDMENMTSDEYPLLAPRKPRRKIMEFAYPGGLHAHEKLCWTERTAFYYDGEYVGQVNPGSHDMVSMGSYVIIWPDKKIFNSQDKKIEDLFIQQASVTQINIYGSGSVFYQKNMDVYCENASAFHKGDVVKLHYEIYWGDERYIYNS